MVNLIIVLISIALVAAIAVATIYNGGDAFRQGSAKASASQLVNAGQQINAANVLYANDNGGSYASTLEELTPEYLASIPRVPADANTPTIETGNVIQVTGINEQICVAVNQQARGNDTIPANMADGAFGCYGSSGTGTDATYTFQFGNNSSGSNNSG